MFTEVAESKHHFNRSIKSPAKKNFKSQMLFFHFGRANAPAQNKKRIWLLSFFLLKPTHIAQYALSHPKTLRAVWLNSVVGIIQRILCNIRGFRRGRLTTPPSPPSRGGVDD